MIRRLFTLFFFAFYTNTYSQVYSSSGVVEYIVFENPISKKERDKRDPLFNSINELSSSLKFSLLFNENESLFSLEEKMESDLNPLAISFANNIVSKGKYYCNRKEKIFLRESQFYDNYTLISSEPFKINWVLSKETKIIDGFVCFKATTSKIKKNNSGLHYFTVEAWYTPDIPISFGPNDFNGLPGLILELKDSHFTFVARKVDIKSDHESEQKILPLTSKKRITEEEHLKNLKKLNNNGKIKF